MEKDNQPKHLIKAMIQRSDDMQISPRSSSTQSAASSNMAECNSKASPEELAALKQDPAIGKYIKMALMGVPFGNVEQKMKLENVDDGDIHRAAVALGHAPAKSNALPSNPSVTSSVDSLSLSPKVQSPTQRVLGEDALEHSTPRKAGK